jgi:hypothetical protein
MSLTAQEVFDKVVAHLRKQNKKSLISFPDDDGITTRCRYRGPDGLMCAVGCLITDEEYNPKWDHDHGSAVIDLFECQSFRDRVGGNNAALLSDLQCLHDSIEVCEWEVQFQKLAKTRSLIYTPPQKQEE